MKKPLASRSDNIEGTKTFLRRWELGERRRLRLYQSPPFKDFRDCPPNSLENNIKFKKGIN